MSLLLRSGCSLSCPRDDEGESPTTWGGRRQGFGQYVIHIQYTEVKSAAGCFQVGWRLLGKYVFANRTDYAGRELLRMSLEKASLFAPGSKANPNPGYQIERAVLHVWISQRPPLSLYMSTGFTPVELIPDYYTSQDVQGGYEMQLTLPYMPVEDKLRAALAKQSTYAGR